METAKANNNLFTNIFSSFQDMPHEHLSSLQQPESLWSFDEEPAKDCFQKTKHLQEKLPSFFPSQYDLDDDFCPKTTLTLNHVTSFGKNVMENHGKKLGKAYKQFITATQENSESMWKCKEKGLDDEEFDEVCDLGFLMRVTENLKEEQKETVVSNIKSSLESRLFLHEIICRIPEEYSLEPIILLSCIIECHGSFSIANLDQNKLRYFIDENLDKLVEEIGQSSGCGIKNGEERGEEFERMVETWITTIFLGLNGVYEDGKRKRSYSKKLSEEGSPRKLPKLL